MNVVEFDEKCKSCKGTGLYSGMGERCGAAIVCHVCKGTGCNHVKLEYEDFSGRVKSKNIKRVFRVNPGIIIGSDDNIKLSDFGGISLRKWEKTELFPPGSEDRGHTCPAWFYQSADYAKKPEWEECSWGGTFSECRNFKNKESCWERWDDEFDS